MDMAVSASVPLFEDPPNRNDWADWTSGYSSGKEAGYGGFRPSLPSNPD